MKAIAIYPKTHLPEGNSVVPDLIDRFRLSFRRVATVGWLFAILAVATMPTAVAKEESKDLTPEQLQSEIMRFVLRYQASMTQAFDERIEAEGDATLQVKLQETKLANLTGVTNIVLQPYPEVNLLDLIVFLSLTKEAWEKYWMAKVFGRQKGTPLLKVMRNFQNEAWNISKTYLTADERSELANLIAAWAKKNRDMIYVEGVRFGDFAKEFADSALARRAQGAFLFSAVSEATAEMTQMRLMGERYLFLAQIFPFTVRESIRLVTYDILREPKIDRLLTNSESASTQFVRFNNIMEQLPGSIRQEIAIEAKDLFSSFDNREKRLSELLAHTDQSISQGKMLVKESQILAGTIDGTVNKLTPYLRNAEESAEFFDNMRVTLSLTKTTIQDAQHLLTSMESLFGQRPQNVGQRSLISNIDIATTRIERLSDHLFWLTVALIVIVCVTTVAGVLSYRLVASRIAYGVWLPTTRTEEQDALANDRGISER